MDFEPETQVAIKSFYNVYNKLGFGFLEKVYENAIFLELIKYNFHCRKQVPIKVFYEESIVGSYFADIMVNNNLIIELKAAESICEEHELQLFNYLKATDIEVGLLFNFGKTPQFKRKVFSNKFK